MENYETLGTIGEGTYGVVLKARHKETGQVVAIKKFKESDEDEQVRKTALREVRILKQLKHDNIVTLIEVFRRKGKLHLVFEFVERTILEDLERNPDGMHPIEAKKCLWQLLRSIEYCHAHNVIHRDIKPENLLISKNGTLKLCDFGFARTLAGPGARYTDYVATRWYRGPELLTGETQYGKPVDVWAIGCMLPEMASGAPLFPGESDIDQLFHIMRCFGQLPPNLLDVFKSNPLFNGIKIPESLSATETLDRRFPQYGRELLSFMKSCLRYEPEHRATCGELMEHEYFTEDGFVAWFEGELKQMLDRDAADFKMRQKKYRKSMRSRGGDPNAEHRQAHAPPPPPPQQAQHHHAPPPAPSIPPPPPQERAHAPAAAPSLPSHLGSSLHHRGAPELSREALQPLSLGGTYHHPPPPELPAEIAERRPATRGEGGGRRDEKEAPNDLGGSENLGGGMLPNLNRPTTPRASRLLAFPHLASALDAPEPAPMPMPISHSSRWGNPPAHLGGGLDAKPSKKTRQPLLDHDSMPSMPQLRAGGGHTSGHDDGGSSNLPQLREGQAFEQGGGLGGGRFGGGVGGQGLGGGGPSLGGPSQSRGGGKKKASAYDSNNPYSSSSAYGKPPSKSTGTSKAGGGGGGGSSSQNNRGGGGGMGLGDMGVFGQGQAISGLHAAYSLPPNPRTPGDAYGGGGDAYAPSSHIALDFDGGGGGLYGGGLGGGGGTSGFGPPLGSRQYGAVGQYGKYGRRY